MLVLSIYKNNNCNDEKKHFGHVIRSVSYVKEQRQQKKKKTTFHATFSVAHTRCSDRKIDRLRDKRLKNMRKIKKQSGERAETKSYRIVRKGRSFYNNA